MALRWEVMTNDVISYKSFSEINIQFARAKNENLYEIFTNLILLNNKMDVIILESFTKLKYIFL